MAAGTTFPSSMGVRFALGLAEGAVSPAFVTLTSIWYKKREHPLRIGYDPGVNCNVTFLSFSDQQLWESSFWISCNGLAQVIGALMMYGIAHDKTAISQWKVMFIICGALTTFIGILFLFIMPAGPGSAWFLNPQERLIATQRLKAETEGGDRTNFSPSQFKEAAKDIRTYLSFLFGVLITLPSPVIAVSWLPLSYKKKYWLFRWQFASLIIYYLGYSKLETMLYISPAGAVQIVSVWIGIALCYIWPNRRCAISIGLTIVPLTGIILLFALPLSAGWGMIVASWLVCRTWIALCQISLIAIGIFLGLCRLKYIINHSQLECVQYSRKHKKGHCERSVLSRPRFERYMCTVTLG